MDEKFKKRKGETYVKPHERKNPKSQGKHTVKGHMRRIGRKIKNSAKKLIPDEEHREVGGSRAEKEAYDMGYGMGKEAGKQVAEFEGEMTEEELDRAMSQSMDGLTQSAQFANRIAPQLREMAGYEDSMGVGTYQDAPDDETQFVVEELHQQFRNGYYDAFREGYEEGLDRR